MSACLISLVAIERMPLRKVVRASVTVKRVFLQCSHQRNKTGHPMGINRIKNKTGLFLTMTG